MKRTLIGAMIAFAVVLASVSTASAYQIQDYNGNCPQGLKWPSFPVDYYINQDGSSDLGFATVEQIFSDSFSSWESPCCSNFTARYRGTTTRTAYQSGGLVVLSFIEGQWDSSWGPVDSVIGVTLTQFNPTACTIGNAPIVFNSNRFTFTNTGSGTDLQSIATHEIGHLVGLDHSSIGDATMYFAYQGGTIGRSLHSDDINGVCFLYSRPCTCSSANDCLQGDLCINGFCDDVPCQANADCQTGLECDMQTGECGVPPCVGNADCPGGFYCRPDGTCASQCAVCRDCTTNSDCGQSGVCLTDQGKCVTFCQNGECPGDSDCFNLNGASVCLNNDANTTGICPTDYVCQVDEPLLECTTDVQCAANEVCNANNECEPAPDLCANVQCNANETCVNGNCVVNPANNANNTNPTNNANNTNPNNTNNANTNNGNGNGNMNQNGQDDVIIILDDGGSTSESCSTVNQTAGVPWLVVLGFALLGLTRTRRR